MKSYTWEALFNFRKNTTEQSLKLGFAKCSFAFLTISLSVLFFMKKNKTS